MVGKPAAVVIASSPCFKARSPNLGDVSAVIARRLADEPDVVVNTLLTPTYSPKRFSKSSLKRPVVRVSISPVMTVV